MRHWVLWQLIGQLHIPRGCFVTSPAWDLVTAEASQPCSMCGAEGFGSRASYSPADASPCSADPPAAGRSGQGPKWEHPNRLSAAQLQGQTDGRHPAEPPGPQLQRYQLGSSCGAGLNKPMAVSPGPCSSQRSCFTLSTLLAQRCTQGWHWGRVSVIVCARGTHGHVCLTCIPMMA